MATGIIKELLKMQDIFSPNGRLSQSDDMNNIPDGVYYQRGSNDYMPSNAPSGAYNALIMQFTNGEGRIFQFWTSVNAASIYYRFGGTGSGWLGWHKVTSTTV